VRFLAILLAAFSIGAGLAGSSDPQALRSADAGAPGALAEAGAVLAAMGLVALTEQGGRAFRWTAAGALCLVSAYALFWLLLAPVTPALVAAAPDPLPAGWRALRGSWQGVQGARLALQLFALAAFVFPALEERGKASARP